MATGERMEKNGRTQADSYQLSEVGSAINNRDI